LTHTVENIWLLLDPNILYACSVFSYHRVDVYHRDCRFYTAVCWDLMAVSRRPTVSSLLAGFWRSTGLDCMVCGLPPRTSRKTSNTQVCVTTLSFL